MPTGTDGIATKERWRWQNFAFNDFACRHCGEMRMQEATLDRYQLLRTRYGKPMVVTSGYRCRNHPDEASKRAPGAHFEGRAVDTVVTGPDSYAFVELAISLGFTGIGVSQRDGQPRFIHLDDVPIGLPSGIVRPRIWSY